MEIKIINEKNRLAYQYFAYDEEDDDEDEEDAAEGVEEGSRRAGVNFTNMLVEAFMNADPKSAKKD